MIRKSPYLRIFSFLGLSISMIVAGVAMLLSFPFGAEGARVDGESAHPDILAASQDQRCLTDVPYQPSTEELSTDGLESNLNGK